MMVMNACKVIRFRAEQESNKLQAWLELNSSHGKADS